MAHRTKQGQKVHDQKVAGVARRLEREGYRVRADLPGHPKPPTMGGRVPDVHAAKGGKVLVREIETSKTISADKAQHKALQRAADRSGADFRVLKAKPRK